MRPETRGAVMSMTRTGASGGSGAPPDASVEARVARLEAMAAIEALKYRYWRACDGKDPDGIRACFIERGAVIDYPEPMRYDDREGLVGVYQQIAMRKVGDEYAVEDMHHGMHPEIEVTSPTEAAGRWTFAFSQINRLEGTYTQSSMEYWDTYVVEDGEWKIATTKCRVRVSITQPLPAGAVVSSWHGAERR
jgi:hypothetical protein